MKKRIRHKLNVEGDFYVEYGHCTACDAPHYHAPELMGYDEDFHCYFKKQPETHEEIEHAIKAVQVSCCEGLVYAGNNPEILKRLDKECCDIYD